MDARQVFEILVRENAGMLSAFLRAVVRDDAAADDIFQETFLAAWRNLDRYDREKPFGPWLRGIAARTVMAWRRKAARTAHAELDEAALAEVSARFGALAAEPGDTWGEKLDAVRACLGNLPDQDRSIIDLYYREDLTLPEIARSLDQSVETMKKRLQRARVRLAACLRGRLSTEAVPS